MALSLMLLGAPPSATAEPCSDAAGRLESAEGRVIVAGTGNDTWQALAIGDCVPLNSRVQVDGGRAVFRLANETLLRTGGETQLRFSTPDQKRWIRLIDGLLHLITRTPRDLEVESDYVNAGVKGTEFIVASDSVNHSGRVIVLEGEVIAANQRGERAVTAGNAVSADRDGAPAPFTIASPRTAVQWTLDYPPLPLSTPRHTDAGAALRRGDTLAAVRALDAIPIDERDADYLALRAAADLQRGAASAARESLRQALDMRAGDRHALALLAVADIATGNLQRAEERLDAIEGEDATTLIARSYLQQARFDLDAARASAALAATLNPSDAMIQARVAELALMSGHIAEAEAATDRALALQPGLARAHALNGFVQLQRLRLSQAERAFTTAAQLDSSDALARLGLGLIDIRRNRLEAGRRQLELAVALDPGQSLLRSYLGKAYQLEQRDALAEEQYTLARQFDDADPTPWLYGALLAQSQNRPFEALRMIEESIARNDNRAVYRSRLQLEGDEATRTASQADIYRELGFTQLAQRSAARAVTSAPGDYGGHRQLAESYADDPQYDAARASEVLQAQLLQPLSATPVQPLLAETNLLVTSGAGPGALGFRNYDALFVREQPQLQIAGLGGSNSTGAGQVSLSGLADRLSYAFDRYYYETQGHRNDSDARYDISSLQLGLQATDRLSLMLAASRRDESRGDITEQLFEQTRPDLELDSRLDAVTLGGRLAITPALDLLAVFSHRDGETLELQQQPTQFGELFSTSDLTENASHAQLQTIVRALPGQLIAGLDWSEGERDATLYDSTTDPILALFLPTEATRFTGTDNYRSGYGYWSMPLTELLNLTVGISRAELESDKFDRRLDGWYPKLALMYRPLPQLQLRATYFRSLQRPALAGQTLEPTQLGEFNQLIDDREGTESSQYGLGFDADLGSGHRIGGEWLERDPKIPFGTGIIETERRQAQLYWNWGQAPWAVSLSYQYDQGENSADLRENIDLSLANVPSSLRTERIPMELRWVSGSGLTLAATLTHIEQHAEQPAVQLRFDGSGNPLLETTIDRANDSFTLLDLAATYRFWQRHAELSLRLNNVTDESFRYHSTNLYDTTPQLSPHLPERTLMGGIKLTF